MSSQESREEVAAEYMARTYRDMCVTAALDQGVIDNDRAKSLRSVSVHKIDDLSQITDALNEDVIRYCLDRDYTEGQAGVVHAKVMPSLISFIAKLDKNLS